MLQAAGYRVHAYTSPHLERFNERIRLAGAIIGDTRLADALHRVERANAGAPITFFEATTAAAFLAMVETPADVVLLETGLGGRLDAPNLLDRPAVTAVTPIGLEHMASLGAPMAESAGGKAGLPQQGVAAVLAPPPTAAARGAAHGA